MTDKLDDDRGDQHLLAVYKELRKLAQSRLSRARSSPVTLEATALVHEAYVRLAQKRDGQPWNSRAHFFGAAARAMRDILVEYARQKSALKRGGDLARVDITLDLPEGRTNVSLEGILTLEQALEEMQEQHPDKAELVLLRYFAGLSVSQIADMRGVSTRTVEREWRFARAWLKTHVSRA